MLKWAESDNICSIKPNDSLIVQSIKSEDCGLFWVEHPQKISNYNIKIISFQKNIIIIFRLSIILRVRGILDLFWKHIFFAAFWLKMAHYSMIAFLKVFSESYRLVIHQNAAPATSQLNFLEMDSFWTCRGSSYSSTSFYSAISGIRPYYILSMRWTSDAFWYSSDIQIPIIFLSVNLLYECQKASDILISEGIWDCRLMTP